jgi:ComF family protein
MLMKHIYNIYKNILNIMTPPLCGLCHRAIDDALGLCPDCIIDAHYITPHQCKICGYPFELPVGTDMLCMTCVQKIPAFDRAFAPFYYAGSIRTLVMGLKHGDKTYLAPLMAQMMSRYLMKYNLCVDMVMPVPLHIHKLFKRKYNQSALIAKFIARTIHAPMVTHILYRIKDGTQKNKTSTERQHNLHHSFICKNEYEIKNKSILLVDDVMTTGATANEIAKTLKKSGAKSVHVITLARVNLDYNFKKSF